MDTEALEPQDPPVQHSLGLPDDIHKEAGSSPPS